MSANRAATIYDVADAAGVSITTVSRVLNSPLQVSESTRERVIRVMQELQFVPKAEAAARARKDFKRIGVLAPFFTAPSFVQRIRGITSALSSGDYELIVYDVENVDQLKGYLSMLPLSRRIDGLIVLALPFSDEDARRFTDFNLHTVSVEFSHSMFSSVEIDNREGGRIAARYLYSRGYRRLAFIGEGGQPTYSLHATDQRLQGFREEIERLGMELPDDYCRFHLYGMEFSVNSAKELFRLPEPPDAVFTASDWQAVGVIKAAREINIRIPEDVAVLGFDDIDLADYMDFSSINQSLDESGRTAVELLMETMRDPTRTRRNVMLQLKLVERSTT